MSGDLTRLCLYMSPIHRVKKRDLLALCLSGTYCHKPGTRPPRCYSLTTSYIFSFKDKNSKQNFFDICIYFAGPNFQHFLRILTSEWELCKLFAGQNHIFQRFDIFCRLNKKSDNKNMRTCNKRHSVFFPNIDCIVKILNIYTMLSCTQL